MSQWVWDKISIGVYNRHQQEHARQKEIKDLAEWQREIFLSVSVDIFGFVVAILTTGMFVCPPQYLGIPSSDATGVLSFLSLVFSAYAVFYAVSFIYSQAKYNGLFSFPAYLLPSWFVGKCIAVAFLAIVSCIPMPLAYVARWTLLLMDTHQTFWVIGNRKRTKALVEDIRLARERDTNKQGKVTYCEVCAKESLYELCLDCEQKYRPERHRIRAQILRAKQAGTEASLTLPQWLTNLSYFNSRCAYCHGDYQVIEHYVPISQGGGTTQENCFPACYSCNSKKSNKHPDKIQKSRTQEA